MRVNYYRFPEGIDAHTRFLNGAANKGGDCKLNRDTCSGCDHCDAGWSKCREFRCTAADDVISGISVMDAKRLLRSYGGVAWTQHHDRNGSCFATTTITTNGSKTGNSRIL